MFNAEQPEPIIERDGFVVSRVGDNVVIANEDGEAFTTVPLCGCSPLSLATLVLPVFVSGWSQGARSGRRSERADIVSAVNTIASILKAGGLLPFND